jgi:restriction system protein
MHNYSTLEIKSIGILLVLFFYFLFKLIWFIKDFRNRSLLKRNKTLKKLKRLSWDDFERLCMELFEKNGWSVKGNAQKGADGGVDIWIWKRSLLKKKISAIVQCKRYEDSMVTIKVIREMYGLMYEYEVDEAYVVTTSRFTKECYKFIEEKNIVLIDGNKLVEMIN